MIAWKKNGYVVLWLDRWHWVHPIIPVKYNGKWFWLRACQRRSLWQFKGTTMFHKLTWEYK